MFGSLNIILKIETLFPCNGDFIDRINLEGMNYEYQPNIFTFPMVVLSWRIGTLTDWNILIFKTMNEGWYD